MITFTSYLIIFICPSKKSTSCHKKKMVVRKVPLAFPGVHGVPTSFCLFHLPVPEKEESTHSLPLGHVSLHFFIDLVFFQRE